MNRQDASGSYLIVLTTVPDTGTAEHLATVLLDRRLAACVNLMPEMRSYYNWEGKRESAAEHLLLIKTRRELYEELEAAIASAHPYELPEIIALPLETGLAGYLRWIDGNTTS
jgi:periplasmic divalent cation tolerance protein